MKFHSFLENIHMIISGFHSIQKNIHVLTRALIQFKISFNSKKILVIHSRKLFIFLKNQLSDTPTSMCGRWWRWKCLIDCWTDCEKNVLSTAGKNSQKRNPSELSCFHLQNSPQALDQLLWKYLIDCWLIGEKNVRLIGKECIKLIGGKELPKKEPIEAQLFSFSEVATGPWLIVTKISCWLLIDWWKQCQIDW